MLAGRAGLPSCFGGLAGATYTPKTPVLKSSSSSANLPTVKPEPLTSTPTSGTADVIMADLEDTTSTTTTTTTTTTINWKTPSDLIMNVEASTTSNPTADVPMSDSTKTTDTTTTTTTATTTTEEKPKPANETKEAVESKPTTPSVSLDGVPVIDVEDEGYFDNDVSLTDPNFLKKLNRMSKTIFRRLQSLAVLGEFVRSNFSGFNENTSWPVSSAALTPGFEHLGWWKGKHDKDLLIGVYRYGFGRYVNKTLKFFASSFF